MSSTKPAPAMTGNSSAQQPSSPHWPSLADSLPRPPESSNPPPTDRRTSHTRRLLRRMLPPVIDPTPTTCDATKQIPQLYELPAQQLESKLPGKVNFELANTEVIPNTTESWPRFSSTPSVASSAAESPPSSLSSRTNLRPESFSYEARPLLTPSHDLTTACTSQRSEQPQSSNLAQSSQVLFSPIDIPDHGPQLRSDPWFPESYQMCALYLTPSCTASLLPPISEYFPYSPNSYDVVSPSSRRGTMVPSEDNLASSVILPSVWERVKSSAHVKTTRSDVSGPHTTHEGGRMFSRRYKATKFTRHVESFPSRIPVSSIGHTYNLRQRVHTRADAYRKHMRRRNSLEEARPQAGARKRSTKRVPTSRPLTSLLRSAARSRPSPSGLLPATTIIRPRAGPRFSDISQSRDVSEVFTITPGHPFGPEQEPCAAPTHTEFCEEKFSRLFRRGNLQHHIPSQHPEYFNETHNLAAEWTSMHIYGACDAAYNQVNPLRRHKMRRHHGANMHQRSRERELENASACGDHFFRNPDISQLSRIQNVTGFPDNTEDEDFEEAECWSIVSTNFCAESIYPAPTNRSEQGASSSREQLTDQDQGLEYSKIAIGVTTNLVKRSISLPHTGTSLRRHHDIFPDQIQHSISTPFTSEVPHIIKDPLKSTDLHPDQVSLFYASRERPILLNPDGGDFCRRTNSRSLRRCLTVALHNTPAHAGSDESPDPTHSPTAAVEFPVRGKGPFPGLIRSTSLQDACFLESVGRLEQMRHALRHQPHYFHGGKVSESGRTAVLNAAYPSMKCQHCAKVFTGQNRRRSLAEHRRRAHNYGSRTKARRRGSRRSRRFDGRNSMIWRNTSGSMQSTTHKV